MKIAVSVSRKEKGKGAASPYFKALVAAGASAEEIDLVAAPDRSRALGGEFDGVLFAGGEDVDPSLYDESIKDKSVHVDRPRDEFESALLDHALEQRLPILGICRGMQMIDVKFGGSLYQDLASDVGLTGQLKVEHKQPGDRTAPSHDITVTEPESRLGEVFRGSCRVNSLHHQAVKRVGRGLKVTAYSEDSLPEAVEAAGEYPYLLAVQWHPEEMMNQPEQRKIFEQFIAKCREAAALRAGHTA